MTLEERKDAIIVLLKLLKDDCAWFNEQHHIDEAIEIIDQCPLKSDIYPDDHISIKWKKEHDKKIDRIRADIER